MKKATKFLLILIITLAHQTISTSSFAQGVGINADGSSAHGSAMLDIKSTTSGVIIPRMTTAQRDNIATACSCTPVEGLLIFNTETKCFEAYVNGAWNTGFCPAACTPPSAPTANAASGVGCTSFTANWSAAAGATSYFLDVATDVGFTTFVSGYNNLNVGNIQTQNIASLTSNTTYYYRVRATTGCVSVNSNTINTTTTAAPSAPTANAATNFAQTSITANWSASSGATGYYLDVASDAGFTTFVTGYNNLNVNNVTTYNVTGLSSNTTYYYRVRAYNTCGSSASSNTISFTTLYLTANIVSYWKLEGNSNDAVGSNNGTDVNITYSSGNGKINQGASFNGFANYDANASRIVLPNNAVEYTGDLSINAWVNLTSNSSSLCIFSCYRDIGGDNAGYGFTVDGTQHLTFFISPNIGGYGGNVVLTGSVISTGTWVMCTVVRTGSTGTQLYINGSAAGSNSNTTNPAYTTTHYPSIGNLKFGSLPTENAQCWNGSIDEVGIWSRALSAAEVSALYNSGTGLQYPF